MAQSTKEDVGEFANQSVNDQTTDEQTNTAPFLTLLNPLNEHNVILDMARCFTAQISHLSQGMDSLKSQMAGLTKQANDILLRLQESADAHKLAIQHIQLAAKASSVEQALQSILRISATPQLKRGDIGRFNPGHPDKQGMGMVTADGCTLVFTNVDLFVEHIESFLQDPATAAANERQLLQWVEALLAGPAAMWWSHELTRVDRRALRRAGLPEILAGLERRFRLSPAVAAVKFEHGKLGLREIAFDEDRPMQFVRAKLRYARAMELLDEDDGEWLFVMLQIWFSMDVDIRAVLSPPTPSHSLARYLEQIRQTTPDLMSRALKLHF
ncbi:hypothetical protein F4814DRAFT_460065 [Daldinia grandis]|nr:hypothetical protein F4814DRAFT_460065 [Daldinia grandis]